GDRCRRRRRPHPRLRHPRQPDAGVPPAHPLWAPYGRRQHPTRKGQSAKQPSFRWPIEFGATAAADRAIPNHQHIAALRELVDGLATDNPIPDEAVPVAGNPSLWQLIDETGVLITYVPGGGMILIVGVMAWNPQPYTEPPTERHTV